MTQAELLLHLVDALEGLDAEYMIGGSHAGMYYGELYKLLYIQQVDSVMHARDIVGILRVSGPELDERYIAQWADQLGVRTLWERVRGQTA